MGRTPLFALSLHSIFIRNRSLLMKHFAALLLLLFLGLGLSSCSSEPKDSKDLLTGTVWGLSDLNYRGGSSSTTIAIRATFLRKGQVLLDVGFGKLVEESNNGGTKLYERSNSVSVTASYASRIGVVPVTRVRSPNSSLVRSLPMPCSAWSRARWASIPRMLRRPLSSPARASTTFTQDTHPSSELRCLPEGCSFFSVSPRPPSSQS